MEQRQSRFTWSHQDHEFPGLQQEFPQLQWVNRAVREILRDLPNPPAPTPADR
jgi:hypothetical protein